MTRRAATVTTGAVCAALALMLAAAPPLLPAATALAQARPLLVRFERRGVYKPRRYCPANHTCFANARWVTWGRRAVAWADATTSYPGSDAVYRHRIRFTFDRPRRLCGGLRYTRARWRQPGMAMTTTTLLAPACTWTGA